MLLYMTWNDAVHTLFTISTGLTILIRTGLKPIQKLAHKCNAPFETF